MLTRCILLIVMVISLTACSVVTGTIDGVTTVGKVGWTTAKVASKVVHTTGKIAYGTGKITSKVVRTAVYMSKGKQIIPLEKEGNSLYTTVYLGRKKIPARLLIDTGASSMQITMQMAHELGLNLDRAERIPAQLANGQLVYAREIIIPQVRLKSVRVTNIRAVVLEQQLARDSDGLLGMSFLDHFVFQIDADKPELVLQQKAK